MQFKLGELFSGPGGLALGAFQASSASNGFSVRHGWANDIDPDSCATYAHNICEGEKSSVYCKPVQDLPVSKMPPIDALAFGFPCNDYSIVGERKGLNGTYGPLYTYGVKVINQFKPKWFVAENVGGLQNANSGIAFKKILADLEGAGAGYILTPHLYKFEEYGVPQKRHRIIIVGIRKDLGVTFRVPATTTSRKHVTAFEALSRPRIPANATNNELTKQSPRVIERLKHIPPGKNAWFNGIPNALRLNVKGALLSQIYKRLHPAEAAYTITGSGGGGTHVYHWKENRALTNRERARLQTFPDSYVFFGSKESVRKQIGMAVPPRGAKVIITAILKSFSGTRYESIERNSNIESIVSEAIAV